MKNNQFKNTMTNEATAKVEAAAKAAREAELAAIEPASFISTMGEIKKKALRVDRTEEDSIKGVNGGKYLQTLLDDGTVIGATTPEELEVIKERHANGIKGDSLLTKLVYINGMKCLCTGATEEELEEDIRAAENEAAAHKQALFIHADKGEQLVDAGIKEKDLTEVEVKDQTLLVYKPNKSIMDLDGHEIANLSDFSSELNEEDQIRILKERAEHALPDLEFIDEDDDCCYDDKYDDDYDDDCYEDEEEDDYGYWGE